MQVENALLNDFIERLNSLEDIRRGEGQRHDHSFALLIVMLATAFKASIVRSAVSDLTSLESRASICLLYTSPSPRD